MKDRKLKNVPILDQGSRPIGVLNARDLLEALLQAKRWSTTGCSFETM